MFLRSKSVLFGRQVLHKSLMSSYNVRLLHGRHSIGHNVQGLAMGWYFIMSSPEPKLKIVTKDEDNN